MKQQNLIAKLSRREALYGLGAGIGSLAFSSMAQAENINSIGIHHPAKAKRCIFLMMEGGPSHIDTFDPKPELDKRHLQRFNRSGERESAMSSGERYFVKSPFDFLKAGKCGADFSSEWHHLKNYADDSFNFFFFNKGENFFSFYGVSIPRILASRFHSCGKRN